MNKCCIEKYDNNIRIGECFIETDDNGTFIITRWFVNKEYQNQGIGRQMMHDLLCNMIKTYGLPVAIDYIWNGTNRYVMDWLENNFNPLCAESIAVLKNSSEDTPLSHVYHLNVDKFIDYFNLRKEI